MEAAEIEVAVLADTPVQAVVVLQAAELEPAASARVHIHRRRTAA
jgi:hypothetical protein